MTPSYNVGFLIPTYNRPKDVVKRALVSALNQQYFFDSQQDGYDVIFKFFICSDTEQPEEHILELLQEKPFSNYPLLYEYEALGRHSNNFANDPRNHLIKMATKANMDFVLFLDDDNLIYPEYTKVALSKLLEDNVDFVVSKIIHMGPLPQHIGEPPKILDGKVMKVRNIDTLQFFMKLDCIKEHGWDTKAGYIADGVTFEGLGWKYKYSYTDKILGVHI